MSAMPGTGAVHVRVRYGPVLGEIVMPEIGKIRPQIFLAIICATLFSCFVSYLAYKMGGHIEVMTAIIGGIFGFLGGVSLKVLENE
jgi:uncharacterized membrane protein YjjP (DUF1212 family)